MATSLMVFSSVAAAFVIWVAAVPVLPPDLATTVTLPTIKLALLPSNKTEKAYVASSILYEIGILEDDDSEENDTDVSTESISETVITLFHYSPKNATAAGNSTAFGEKGDSRR